MYILTTQTDALDFVKHGNSELKVRKSPDRKRAKKTPDHFFFLSFLHLVQKYTLHIRVQSS